jgi:hypothetical protein
VKGQSQLKVLSRRGTRRQIAHFFIKSYGLRKLHGSKLQRFIRAVLDEIDLQHIKDSQVCANFADRWQMWRFAQQEYIKNEPIDYLEFGVFEGESIRHWLALNVHKDSRFFGFDSFEGLPEDWHGEKGKGYFGVHGEVPLLADSRLKFIKGWFEDTVPTFTREFRAKNHLVVHIDCDLYAGAMLGLVYLTPFMSKGTILIFDEFLDREHEFKAFMDWQRIHKKGIDVIAEAGNYQQICVELQ